MNSNFLKPLPVAEFYILLALGQLSSHAYALIDRVINLSVTSVRIPTSRIYILVGKLEDQAFIEPIGQKPSGMSGKSRLQYQISQHGRIRLHEELNRLNHAVLLGKAAGIMDNPIPTDIQRLILGNQAP